MLYLCKYPPLADGIKRDALLVDAPTEAAARELARGLTDDEDPARVFAIEPGAFVAEVEADEDEDEEGNPIVGIHAVDHTIGVLLKLLAAPLAAPAAALCAQEADAPDGSILTCARPVGPAHGPEHVAASGHTWTVEP